MTQTPTQQQESGPDQRLLIDTFAAGKKEGWEACEACHGIVDGVHQRSAELERVQGVLVEALKRLSFAAQTTGGTAGRDDELVEAISKASAALAAVKKPEPCATCNGHGMVGGYSGQTAESHEFHSEPCPDCAAQQYAHGEYFGIPLDDGLVHDDVGAQLSAAAADVLAERRRQIEAEGWTPEHDDAHEAGAMADAAACYAMNASVPMRGLRANIWPWAGSWWKPSTPRRDLVKAGALILAEIERIDRAAQPIEPECERCGEGVSRHTPEHWCDNQSFVMPAAQQPEGGDRG